MIKTQALVEFLDRLLLEPCSCADSSNNGLQVEGSETVRTVVFGVDACQALFDRAAQADAGLVFVHHGLSWRDNLKYLTGITARRLGTLFKHDISLYAAHLPLDQHPEVGHNAIIADRLGLVNRRPFFLYGGSEIGVVGDLPEAMLLTELAQQVNAELHTDADVVPAGPATVHRIGVVSGGAADAVGTCPEVAVDCLVTGEMGHTHYHTAHENRVNVIAAGHYRSELPGIEAVMERVGASFDVECLLIDLPTGY